MTTLAERAAAAPRGPGVYLFLDGSSRLLYAGSARDIGVRLRSHARADTGRRAVMVKATADVRWIRCADADEALRLESDVIVATRPRFNALLDDAFVFLCVIAGDRSTLVLSSAPVAGARVHGGFPHLGKGKASRTAHRANAGFTTLLRVLWAAAEDPLHLPARLRGTSPPVEHTARLGDVAGVNELFAGRSPRILKACDPASLPAVVRTRFRADAAAALDFYRHGPRRMAALRRRHGLRGPVDRTAFREAIVDDLRSAIGHVEIDAPEDIDAVVGTRTARSMHFRHLGRTS